MNKKYVLDTSIILSNPSCLKSFPNATIIIQESVLRELDKMKTNHGEIGKNARVFIRLLDELSEQGDIGKGVKTKYGSTLLIDVKDHGSRSFGDPAYADNKILACANALNNNSSVTLVSNDINLRLRAKVHGVDAMSLNVRKSNTNEFYSGVVTIENRELGEKLKKELYLDCHKYEDLKNLSPNQCVYFTDENKEVISLARRIKGRLRLVKDQRPWNLSSKNIEQALAIDLIMDPKIPLVSLAGRAGTGKTLLAVACGLESVITKKQYNKLLVYRPIQPVGTDMGYLPGELADKLEPWMAAIHDSMDFLANPNGRKKNGNGRKINGKEQWRNGLAQYEDQIHLEALTYIRGRSISNAFIIMDETQNVSVEDIKTLLTRVGHGTKIVLTGDIEQIDSKHLDAMHNGLTNTIDKFRSSSLAGHLTLVKGERSQLATYAASVL
jgi:PhoH-like ATPase